jgi:uncharacterized protein YbaR (Trm112 family)
MQELLQILRCPETRQTLTIAGADVIERLNGAVTSGGLKTRGGKPITEKIDGGLIREDRKFLYPIRGKIPVMLIDEAIPL